MPEERKIRPFIFNVMRDPSIIDGNEKFKKLRIEKKFNEQYNKYISKNETIAFTVYSDNHNTEYLFHFQIVSQSADDVLYDVLIRFYDKDKTKRSDLDISKYDFQVFSNSPGFVFQFAYVYNKGGYFIEKLKKKIDGIDIPPTKTNPTEAYGYDYCLYFAMYFLYLNKQYMKKAEIERISKPLANFDMNDVLSAKEAFRRRNPKQFSTYERVKKKTKELIELPKKGFESIKKAIGVTPVKKAIKPVKAKKAIRSPKRHFK